MIYIRYNTTYTLRGTPLFTSSSPCHRLFRHACVAHGLLQGVGLFKVHTQGSGPPRLRCRVYPFRLFTEHGEAKLQTLRVMSDGSYPGGSCQVFYHIVLHSHLFQSSSPCVPWLPDVEAHRLTTVYPLITIRRRPSYSSVALSPILSTDHATLHDLCLVLSCSPSFIPTLRVLVYPHPRSKDVII